MYMTTINVSLPDKLKQTSNELIESGYYASFSDLVRHSLRQTIDKHEDYLMSEAVVKDVTESRHQMKSGKGKLLKSLKDLR